MLLGQKQQQSYIDYMDWLWIRLTKEFLIYGEWLDVIDHSLYFFIYKPNNLKILKI